MVTLYFETLNTYLNGKSFLDLKRSPNETNLNYDLPISLQGCGQPGDFMALPYEFLVRWNRTWETWGDPAKLFVHEWAKLRYGVFDEFGFNRDPLYPNYFKYNGQGGCSVLSCMIFLEVM